MLVRAPLAPGAVLAAVSGGFCGASGGADTRGIVLARETVLEMLRQSGDGGELTSVCVHPVFSVLRSVARVGWRKGLLPEGHELVGCDILALTSASGKLSFVGYSRTKERFVPITGVDVAAPGFGRRELGHMVAVAPGSGAIAVAAMQELVAVFLTTAAPALQTRSRVEVCVTHRDLMARYPSGHSVLPAQQGDSGRANVGQSSMVAAEPPQEGWAQVGERWGTLWDMAFLSGREPDAPVLALLHSRPGQANTDLHLVGVDTIMARQREEMHGGGFDARCALTVLACVPTPSLPRSSSLGVVGATSRVLFTHIARLPQRAGAQPGSGGPESALLLGEGTAVYVDTEDTAAPRDTYVVALPQCARVVAAAAEPEGMDMEVAEHAERPGGGSGVGAEGIGDAGAAGPGRGADTTDLRSGGGLVSVVATDESLPGLAALIMEGGIAQLVQTSSRGMEMLSAPLALPDECTSAVWLPLPWRGRRALLCHAASGDAHVLLMDDASGGLTLAQTTPGLASVVDFELADLYGEGQDQLFAVSGSGRPSLRVVRHGVGVEHLLRTACDYQGVTGAWRVPVSRADPCDALLVLSFVFATRALALGATLMDVTESVGLNPSAATLACGRVADGLMVQVCDTFVVSATLAREACGWMASSQLQSQSQTQQGSHAGLASSQSSQLRGSARTLPLPPDSGSTQCAAVGEDFVVMAVSRPSPALLVMEVVRGAGSDAELAFTRRIEMRAEVSCLSLPPENMVATLPANLCVVGTYLPSAELVDIGAGGQEPLGAEAPELLAMASLQASGTPSSQGDGERRERAAMGSAVPESVAIVVYDQPYVMVGLRNGCLVRFEWPGALQWVQHRASFASGADMHARQLRLVSRTQLGRTPVSLVPLVRAARVPVLALSDWPWVISPSRSLARLACTAVALPPGVGSCVRAAPFACAEPSVPSGVLFATGDGALHLTALKAGTGGVWGGGSGAATTGTYDISVLPLECAERPRRIQLHSSSGALIVACAPRSHSILGDSMEVCAVDPFTGATLASIKVPGYHVACAIATLKVFPMSFAQSAGRGNGGYELVAVGCSSHAGPADVESCAGTIHLLQLRHPTASKGDGGGEDGAGSGWEFALFHEEGFEPGYAVRALATYREHGLVAGIGRRVMVLVPHMSKGIRVAAVHRCRNPIVSVSCDGDRIIAGDSLDGLVVLKPTLEQDEVYGNRGLERLWSDPHHRLVSSVAACAHQGAIAVDKAGQIVLCAPPADAPERAGEHQEAAVAPPLPPPGQLQALPSVATISCGPERNLQIECVTDVNEGMLRIRPGMLSLSQTQTPGAPERATPVVAADGEDGVGVAETHEAFTAFTEFCRSGAGFDFCPDAVCGEYVTYRTLRAGDGDMLPPENAADGLAALHPSLRRAHASLGGGDPFVAVTVLGRVLTFESLSDEHYQVLMRIQRRCLKHEQLASLVGAKHPSEPWDGEYNMHEPHDPGFVSGDVLAQLVDVDETVRREVMGADAAAAASLLEELLG